MIHTLRVLPHILQDLLLQVPSFVAHLHDLSCPCQSCGTKQRNRILRLTGNPFTNCFFEQITGGGYLSEKRLRDSRQSQISAVIQPGLLVVATFIVLINPQVCSYTDLIMISSLFSGPFFLRSFECIQATPPTHLLDFRRP